MREFKTLWQRRPYSVLEARTPPSTRTDRISREYPDRTLPRLDCVSCPHRSPREWNHLKNTARNVRAFALSRTEMGTPKNVGTDTDGCSPNYPIVPDEES